MAEESNVSTPQANSNSLLITYRSLRLSLVLAVLMLGIAVVTESIRAGELRGSISSYFYSPVRSIFVGAMLVIGFSLIVIHVRHRWEESWLTLGGMLAIVVALVPTGLPTCSLPVTTTDAIGAGDEIPQPVLRDIADRALMECFPHAENDSLPDWILSGIWNNVLALVITALVAVWVTRQFTDWSAGAVSEQLKIAIGVYTALLVVGAFLFWLWGDFRSYTHVVAAILTFICVGAVSLINGWRRKNENPVKYQRIYRFVTIGMIVAFLAFIVAKIGGGFDTDVFWLEAVEISLFGSFWLAQTVQHWNEPTS